MPTPSSNRGRYVLVVIPRSKTKLCHVTAGPDTPPDKLVEALRTIEIPTDASVLSPEMREAIGELQEPLPSQSVNLLKTVASGLGRPITVFLCDHPGAESDTNRHELISVLDTDGLWPHVGDDGHLIVEDTAAVANENRPENMKRFAVAVMDLATGRRGIVNSRAAMIVNFQSYLNSSQARTRLRMKERFQKPQTN